MSESKAVIIESKMQHKMQQDAVDFAKQAMGKYKNLEVCQYSEIMCLVGWLVSCEIPSVDTFSLFRMLHGILEGNLTRSTNHIGIALLDLNFRFPCPPTRSAISNLTWARTDSYSLRPRRWFVIRPRYTNHIAMCGEAGEDHSYYSQIQ
jgi:hypothetical protein